MNVKKGDLAVIIKSTFGLNIGRIVEVGDMMGEHSQLGAIWHVRTKGRALVTDYGAIGPECDCADDWLRPLPADDANSGALTDQPLEIAA